MNDADCIALLQWALPRLDLRWEGFRKVRRQVCKRIARRLKALGLETVEQYRELLARDEAEWGVLDAACRITISRFYRDRRVFEVLGESVLPQLAQCKGRKAGSVHCWCAGCASGEEVYTLAIMWEMKIRPVFPGLTLDSVATDADPVMIARAKRACYGRGSLKDMPPAWLSQAFEEKAGGEFCVRPRYRSHATILEQDIRVAMPEGQFDLVLCRNLVLTYFNVLLQKQLIKRILHRLRPGGYLVIGAHETLPEGIHGLDAIPACREILHRANGPGHSPVGS